MSAKRIAFDQDAREAIRRGVKQLGRAVKVTLKPCGCAVLLEKKWGAPKEPETYPGLADALRQLFPGIRLQAEGESHD